jgi:hypothetical protein
MAMHGAMREPAAKMYLRHGAGVKSNEGKRGIDVEQKIRSSNQHWMFIQATDKDMKCYWTHFSLCGT